MGSYWEFPGGKIEPGETPKASLAREISEELGITIQVGEHFYSNSHDYGSTQILLMAYWCRWSEGDLILKDHDAIKWCTSSDLKHLNWATADIPISQALIAAVNNTNERIHLL